MIAEIIAVGTELLMGQIANTNAQFISQQLAGIGVNVYFHTVVGDNPERIRQALEIASSRATFVIMTGGLGPTQDDLTKDVVAAYVEKPLALHAPTMEFITEFFRSRGIKMVDSNIKQAQIIEGTDALPNHIGLAVGNALTHKGTHYMMLPGPPRELKPMFTSFGIPWIRSQLSDTVPLYSKMLKFAGIGESTLENKLIDLIEKQQDPTIAPYAKEGEVTIRVTTRAANEAAGEAKMAETLRQIKERVGDHLYAEQDIGIEAVVIEFLRKTGKTLAVAESCTGGLLGDLITTVPGSSDSFVGGLITYSNRMKIALLGVPEHIVAGENAPGAVSEQTAALMAEGAMQRTGADYALAITGVAGPSESEGKPVGLVYIALAERNIETTVWETKQSGDRGIIKLRAAKHALYRLWRRLKESTQLSK